MISPHPYNENKKTKQYIPEIIMNIFEMLGIVQPDVSHTDETKTIYYKDRWDKNGECNKPLLPLYRRKQAKKNNKYIEIISCTLHNYDHRVPSNSKIGHATAINRQTCNTAQKNHTIDCECDKETNYIMMDSRQVQY